MREKVDQYGPLTRNESAFRDDQSSAALGALRVVFQVDLIRDIDGQRPAPRHCRHHIP